MLERRNINSGLEFQYHTNKKYCFELDINTKKDSNIVECLEVTYPMAHDHQVQSIPHLGITYQMKIGHTFGPIHLFTLEKQVKGPGWFVLPESITKFETDPTKKDTWCKWDMGVNFEDIDEIKYI